MTRTRFINRNGCVARDLVMRQGGRRENVLYEMGFKFSFLLVMLVGIAASLPAETAPSPKASPVAAKKPAPVAAQKTDKSPANKFLGQSGVSGSNEPTTTEIYADEAFFDSNKSMGIFTGHVKVTDPRFNLQSEKLTVFISKGENQGLEKAIAEGNVGVVRDRPDPNGGPPTRAVGRSDTATYTASTGDVELKGTPRVQQGENTHIATSPDTIMIINQSGQLTTHGPSRTDIRQEPNDENGDEKGNGGGANKTDGKSKGERKANRKADNKASPVPKQ
jgi:lipopolysaccharide transport protein LptA